MTTTMSRSQAIREAKAAVSMYRQGRGWIVSGWDEQARAHRVSNEMDHGRARRAYANSVVYRALRKLGIDEWDAMRSEQHEGSIEERVRQFAPEGR
jgi:hypothetical protein